MSRYIELAHQRFVAPLAARPAAVVKAGRIALAVEDTALAMMAVPSVPAGLAVAATLPFPLVARAL